MSDRPASPPVVSSSPWPRVILWLGLAIVLVGGGILATERFFHGVGEVITTAKTLAETFHRGTVKEEFLSSAMKLEGTSRLQVATLQENETFRRKESDSIAWGLIALPSIVVQADVPVEYGYYLDFNAPWEFAQKDAVVTAYPPPIQPNTPAADISKLTFYTLEGHIWQDDKAVRDRLQGSFSAALRARAAEHIPLVREIARRQLQTFVQKWLADSFADGQAFQVKVIFPDERSAETPETPKPAPKAAE